MLIITIIGSLYYMVSYEHQISCDAHIAVKPVAGKGSSKGTAEGFDVEPTKVSISAHSHVYATITFRPTTMQASDTTMSTCYILLYFPIYRYTMVSLRLQLMDHLLLEIKHYHLMYRGRVACHGLLW